MAIQQEFDAALANAEAALARATIHSADTGANWANTRPKIDHVRLYCRQLRAALAEMDRSESAADGDTARAYCRELRAVFLELNRSAKIPFRCDQPSCSVLQSPRTTCWFGHLENMAAAPDSSTDGPIEPAPAPALAPAVSMHRAIPVSLPRGPIRAVAHAMPSLVRETVAFAALIIAYLQYFFIDVQLQILSLPVLCLMSLPQ
jgi:hypothetical protein